MLLFWMAWDSMVDAHLRPASNHASEWIKVRACRRRPIPRSWCPSRADWKPRSPCSQCTAASAASSSWSGAGAPTCTAGRSPGSTTSTSSNWTQCEPWTTKPSSRRRACSQRCSWPICWCGAGTSGARRRSPPRFPLPAPRSPPRQLQLFFKTVRDELFFDGSHYVGFYPLVLFLLVWGHFFVPWRGEIMRGLKVRGRLWRIAASPSAHVAPPPTTLHPQQVIISPFGLVTFFTAYQGDVLTSLAKVNQDLGYSICFFATGTRPSFPTQATAAAPPVLRRPPTSTLNPHRHPHPHHPGRRRLHEPGRRHHLQRRLLLQATGHATADRSSAGACRRRTGTHTTINPSPVPRPPPRSGSGSCRI